MIVVAIVGILAAIAVPAFSRYVKRSRGAEAVGHLNKIWVGAAAYYNADHADSDGRLAPKQFPTGSAPWESDTECACHPAGRCPLTASSFADPIWRSLGFAISQPYLFMPGYTGGPGLGTNASFTAMAKADLDCDGVLWTLQRFGSIDSMNGDVTGQRTAYVFNEGE